jgi:hypothetical protein
MGASLAAVGEGFAASLAHVLWVIEAWVGIIVTACTAVFVALCLVATRGQQEEHAAAGADDAEVGDDTIAMVRYCPWCEPFPSRPVGAGECTCKRPCEGVSYCLAAVSRG